MRRLILSGSLILTLALVFGLPGYAPVEAVSFATGVALSSYSDCTSPAGLDLSMSADATPTTEGGIATTEDGTTLMSFEQGTGFASFSGTFTGYNFASPAWSVPAGTIVGLYAYIGQPMASATSANTIEWFVAYNCSTQQIVASCYGDYGNCPQSAVGLGSSPSPDATGASLVPGPDMVPIPDTAVVGAFVVTTPIYFAPDSGAASTVVMEAGKTAWVFGLDATGQFYKVVLAGKYFWVPVNTMGPNFDNVWLGRPLPTVVVS
ncbi:MAG: hypothetical protein HY866_19955 [Chloroflexi bacterium]|nr:hypothetical protein [Chloroflexota bacterium]